eukprot:CAMPEP_0115038074 /NCGR_PEP_ID=MMETSP0216-20121206/43186_1 /TAXON_ID=223996 /ORGANISM="Protocruzia adherens, Strain Boccale" /LENGTH=184 /DNA_ID=CAMNT_0002418393 /DNA_START=791 /DNA_END=1345 /DNA_ORIENTATION=-
MASIRNEPPNPRPFNPAKTLTKIMSPLPHITNKILVAALYRLKNSQAFLFPNFFKRKIQMGIDKTPQIIRARRQMPSQVVVLHLHSSTISLGVDDINDVEWDHCSYDRLIDLIDDPGSNQSHERSVEGHGNHIGSKRWPFILISSRLSSLSHSERENKDTENIIRSKNDSQQLIGLSRVLQITM